MAKPNKGTLLEIYKGKKIYNRNAIQISLDPSSYKHFIDLHKETGISVSQLILLNMRPCQACGSENVCYPKIKVRVWKKTFEEDGSK